MKSIKQQYIDLQEGNMTQANFMRNLRMTLPQYVTNVTSFEDSVKILKNKGILTEADEKGKWTNTSGKAMYDQFREIDNLNGQEVLIGIDYEIEKNHELTKAEAAKIVIKNLKKNPIYYTSSLMAGKEGYEPEYLGGKSAQPEAHQMQPLDKNMSNVVDKKRGMQPVKGIEKHKKDSDKGGETNKPEKGISLMSLVAKTSRGVQKMNATGEKMKKIAMKEVKLNNFSNEEPNDAVALAMQFIEMNPVLKQHSDEFTLQNGGDDAILKYNYWEPLPDDVYNKLELQFNVEEDVEEHDDKAPTIAYYLKPKHTPGKVNLNKVDLMNMIREELMEMFDGMEPMDRTGLDEMDRSEEEVKAAAREYGMKLANWYNKNQDAFVSDSGDDVAFIKKMFKKTTPKPQRPSIMYDIADNKILADKFEQIVDDVMRKSGWEGTYDI